MMDIPDNFICMLEEKYEENRAMLPNDSDNVPPPDSLPVTSPFITPAPQLANRMTVESLLCNDIDNGGTDYLQYAYEEANGTDDQCNDVKYKSTGACGTKYHSPTTFLQQSNISVEMQPGLSHALQGDAKEIPFSPAIFQPNAVCDSNVRNGSVVSHKLPSFSGHHDTEDIQSERKPLLPVCDVGLMDCLEHRRFGKEQTHPVECVVCKDIGDTLGINSSMYLSDSTIPSCSEDSVATAHTVGKLATLFSDGELRIVLEAIWEQISTPTSSHPNGLPISIPKQAGSFGLKRMSKREAAKAATATSKTYQDTIAFLAVKRHISDKILLLLKPKKKRRSAKFENPVPSRFCHICSRTPKNVRLAVCCQIRDGVCRKVVCEKCFQDFKLGDFSDALDLKISSWICTHCNSSCPQRAQCNTYGRINDRLRVSRLKQERTIQTHDKRMDRSELAALSEKLLKTLPIVLMRAHQIYGDDISSSNPDISLRKVVEGFFKGEGQQKALETAENSLHGVQTVRNIGGDEDKEVDQKPTSTDSRDVGQSFAKIDHVVPGERAHSPVDFLWRHKVGKHSDEATAEMVMAQNPKILLELPLPPSHNFFSNIFSNRTPLPSKRPTRGTHFSKTINLEGGTGLLTSSSPGGPLKCLSCPETVVEPNYSDCGAHKISLHRTDDTHLVDFGLRSSECDLRDAQRDSWTCGRFCAPNDPVRVIEKGDISGDEAVHQKCNNPHSDTTTETMQSKLFETAVIFGSSSESTSHDRGLFDRLPERSQVLKEPLDSSIVGYVDVGIASSRRESLNGDFNHAETHHLGDDAQYITGISEVAMCSSPKHSLAEEAGNMTYTDTDRSECEKLGSDLRIKDFDHLGRQSLGGNIFGEDEDDFNGCNQLGEMGQVLDAYISGMK